MPNIARILKNKTLIASVGFVVVAAIAIALFFALRKRGIPGRKESYSNIAYKMRIQDPESPTGWRCPKGYKDTGKDWDVEKGEQQCAYMRYKTKLANGKCPDGYVSSGKSDPNFACRHARKGEAEAKKFKKDIQKKDNEACTRDNQCAGGVCIANTCRAKYTAIGDWGWCGSNRWCISKNCNNNKCVPVGWGSSPAPSPPPPPTPTPQGVVGPAPSSEPQASSFFR